ncbi:hypothetical protein GH733_000944 [Mirounga leonina]|nr:hypothetical protein GH733_000944 [Mirounga leonina]
MATSAFQDKLDTLCDFVQTCNQLPLMRWLVLQLHPSEAPLQAVALPSTQPGMLPPQQLLLRVPTPPNHILPPTLQDAAIDLSLCRGTLQTYFVTPTPIVQPLKPPKPKTDSIREEGPCHVTLPPRGEAQHCPCTCQHPGSSCRVPTAHDVSTGQFRPS